MQGLTAEELEAEFKRNKYKKLAPPKKAARIPRDSPPPTDVTFIADDKIVRFESGVAGRSALRSAGRLT